MRLSAILAVLLPGTLLAQKAAFSIHGKIGSINGVKVYLFYPRNGKSVVDSSMITYGRFAFQGNIDEPVKANMIIRYPGWETHWENTERKTIYLEPGDIRIEGNNSLSTAKVSGKINQDYEVLASALKPSMEKWNELTAYHNALPPEKQKDPVVGAEFNKKKNAVIEEQMTVSLTFIKSHTDNVVSLDALKDFGRLNPDYRVVAPLFDSFSEQVKNSAAGKEYAAMLAEWKRTAVGAMAPEFTLKDTSGNPVTLSGYRGKYVLVDFWASGCVPCRAENPNMIRLYAKFRNRGFEILGVSVDDEKSRQDWLRAIRHDGLEWQQVADSKGWNNEAAQLYSIRRLPQNVLVDPYGKIIAKNLRGKALENKLAELFSL
ncbi:TlpA disulfide reductase family protein [Pinibacter soli]|uniref:TlpA disulfide reductase family protein n=1 Tax=Pinibacter soli TaxID=3044211 RepID=A0ABT6RB92_9BACT|nr:TlpA disulfide reductase family protein [Pinibacter soli]MDI3319839.1 TlpA disulfide reductase family protein [Pinibacter soli]